MADLLGACAPRDVRCLRAVAEPLAPKYLGPDGEPDFTAPAFGYRYILQGNIEGIAFALERAERRRAR